jgi:hypothetical protein
MSWNYRVFRRIEEQHTSAEPVYTIASVYYDEDGTMKTFAADAAYPVSETLDGLRGDLDKMIFALSKPVIHQHASGELEEITEQ